MKKSTISKETLEKIKKLYAEGHGAPAIGKILGISTGRVSYQINKHIGARTCSEAARKYIYNLNFFENIDTEEKAYWLGFIYADGYISVNEEKYIHKLGISLSIKDFSHLEKFRKNINGNFPIKQYKGIGYKEIEYCRVILHGEKIVKDLISHGVVEHKTLILKAPKIDENFIHHFIRGYFDGDGSITFTTSRKEYGIKIVGTEEVLNYIKDFIHDKNIAKIKKYYKRRESDTVSCIDFSGNNQVRKFLDEIYKNATVFLDRKHNRYIDLKKMQNSRLTSKDVS